MTTTPRLIYCHCAFAQVVPKAVKTGVLNRLCESGIQFRAVADLCELSARRDPELKQLVGTGPVKIAACYPRAVKGLFIAADAPLPQHGVEVHNMRVESADAVAEALLSPDTEHNLPPDKKSLTSEPKIVKP